MTLEDLNIIEDLRKRLKRCENRLDQLEGKEVKRWTPPTLDEVRSYCKERGNNVDPQKWYDFYCAKNFMIGKNKMKDFKAAVRTWEDKTEPTGRVVKNEIPEDFGTVSPTALTREEYLKRKK